jgi:hypothetical protein
MKRVISLSEVAVPNESYRRPFVRFARHPLPDSSIIGSLNDGTTMYTLRREQEQKDYFFLDALKLPDAEFRL